MLVSRTNRSVRVAATIFRSVHSPRLVNPVNGHITLRESIEVVKRRESRKKMERDAILEDATRHIPNFYDTLAKNGVTLSRGKTNVLQVNIGILFTRITYI
jgi:hypothetical protein